MTQPSGPSHKAEQAERRAIISAEARRDASTFHQFTASEIAQDQQGRFAKGTTIIGQQPAAQYPRLPESNSSNQQAAAVGQEPPLGFSVSEPIVTGEYHEVMASLDALSHQQGESAPLDLMGERQHRAEREVSSFPSAPSSNQTFKRKI